MGRSEASNRTLLNASGSLSGQRKRIPTQVTKQDNYVALLNRWSLRERYKRLLATIDLISSGHVLPTGLRHVHRELQLGLEVDGIDL